MKDKETIEIGPFDIMPYLVDHSAYGAYSILISTPLKPISFQIFLKMLN